MGLLNKCINFKLKDMEVDNLPKSDRFIFIALMLPILTALIVGVAFAIYDSMKSMDNNTPTADNRSRPMKPHFLQEDPAAPAAPIDRRGSASQHDYDSSVSFWDNVAAAQRGVTPKQQKRDRENAEFVEAMRASQ
jgi:hypothetical protein